MYSTVVCAATGGRDSSTTPNSRAANTKIQRNGKRNRGTRERSITFLQLSSPRPSGMTLGTKETRLTKRQTGQNGNDILAPETSFSHHHRVQLVKGQWIRLCGVV